MHLKDTLSRQLQPLEVEKGQKVKIYSCGPTVYDYPHLGNWYSFLRWDLLVRILKSLDFETLWVMNITDVGHLESDADEGEDKLAKKAHLEGKNAYEVADFYTDYFLKALKRLNFLMPDHLPKASEHIKEQIDLVKRLEEKNLTYIIDDGVYYDTSKLKDYGKLARLDKRGIQPGARVEFNPQKKNATDFAIWKLTQAGQKRDMEWDSPWGRGFPGWHLECSAMCWRYLGQPIDIHTGGIDHIPVHHTNELAQSEVVYGEPLAKIWLHSNFANITGEKMSKSLNNFNTLEDIESKGYNLQAFRLAVFGARYYNLAEFNWDLMDAATRRLKRLQALAVRVHQLQETGDFDACRNQLEQTLIRAKEDLADNLNSPKALERVDELSQKLSPKSLPKNLEPALREFLKAIDDLFGLKLSLLPDLTPAQKEIVKHRLRARQKNDFSLSDQLRDELLKDKIQILDTDIGQIWQLV